MVQTEAGSSEEALRCVAPCAALGCIDSSNGKLGTRKKGFKSPDYFLKSEMHFVV